MSKWIGMTIAPAVTGRFRSLEGRPLGMSCSVMLPESARLRLLELGSSFVTALAEQRQPTTGPPDPTAEAALVGGPSGVRRHRAAGTARPRCGEDASSRARTAELALRPRERGATC
jgi:hypothetical protein